MPSIIPYKKRCQKREGWCSVRIVAVVILFGVIVTHACWVRSNRRIDVIGLGFMDGRLQLELASGYGMLSLSIVRYDWPVPVPNAGWSAYELEMNWATFPAPPTLIAFGPEPPPPDILHRLHWYSASGYGIHHSQIMFPTAWMAIGAEAIAALGVLTLSWQRITLSSRRKKVTG